MSILTRQELANNAAKRWKTQYFNGQEWRRTMYGDAERTYAKLLALGATPSPDAVNTAIGNSSWTCLECSKCDQQVEKVFIFEKYDNLIYVCQPCLEAAVEQFK